MRKTTLNKKLHICLKSYANISLYDFFLYFSVANFADIINSYKLSNLRHILQNEYAKNYSPNLDFAIMISYGYRLPRSRVFRETHDERRTFHMGYSETFSLVCTDVVRCRQLLFLERNNTLKTQWGSK